MNLDPPPDLEGVALAKWQEILSRFVADSPDLLTLDAIASYARAHGDEQAALELLKNADDHFTVSVEGKISVHPLRTIVDRARAEMLRLRREIRQRSTVVASTELSPTKRTILAEVARRHAAVADEAPDKQEQAEWESRMEHGPTFSAADWSGSNGNDAVRMQWQRTMKELIDDGLVIASQEDGRKWPNVRLSDAGQQLHDSAASQV